MKISYQAYLTILIAFFALVFIILGISPYDRAGWALENLLAVIFIAVLFLTRHSFPLSKVSYTSIFIFLFFHEIGSHYTYSEVPYDKLFVFLFDFSLNDFFGWERNHYDRFVHLLYGLLLVYPIREVYCRIAFSKGFWGYFFPVELAMASSMMYELFEWGAAVIFGGDLGVAYLGTQGDMWDAQKDMALASLGALITMTVTLLINRAIQKDFSEEFRESLAVKVTRPLGEERFERLLQDK